MKSSEIYLKSEDEILRKIRWAEKEEEATSEGVLDVLWGCYVGQNRF